MLLKIGFIKNGICIHGHIILSTVNFRDLTEMGHCRMIKNECTLVYYILKLLEPTYQNYYSPKRRS